MALRFVASTCVSEYGGRLSDLWDHGTAVSVISSWMIVDDLRGIELAAIVDDFFFSYFSSTGGCVSLCRHGELCLLVAWLLLVSAT